MSDVFDKVTRSAVMSKVRSKGNKSTEMRLIELFDERGIKGWRRNYPVKGHPDFVFPKRRIAVFVDGCGVLLAWTRLPQYSPQTERGILVCKTGAKYSS